MMINCAGQQKLYKLLHVCQFDSTRKRMSVILKDPQGKIILMCKGADSIIYDLLSEESKQSECYAKT